MRIKVHPGLCNGWGECHRWGREIYPLDADGHCEMRLLEVPPEMEDQAWLGAMACPEQAITVIDDAAVVRHFTPVTTSAVRASAGAVPVPADEVAVHLTGRV